MEWYHRYWLEVPGAAWGPLLRMLHGNLLERTIKGLRTHTGKSARKSTVQVRERFESFCEGHHYKELPWFHRPQQGEGKGENTPTQAFLLYREVNTVTITREKTGFRSEGKPELMHLYPFSFLVLEDSYPCSFLARISWASLREKEFVMPMRGTLIFMVSGIKIPILNADHPACCFQSKEFQAFIHS